MNRRVIFMDVRYYNLFSLFCMQTLNMPQDFTELPSYQKLSKRLTSKQNRLLIRIFDEYSEQFSVYAENCFDQGIRFAFLLFLHLYAQDMEY